MVENFGEGDFCIYLFSMDLDSRVWISDFGILSFLQRIRKSQKLFCKVKQKRTHRKRSQGSLEARDEQNRVVSS